MEVLIQNEIPRRLEKRLERIQWAVTTRYAERMTEAMRETQKWLIRNTPKATGRMASGWRLRVYGGGPKSRTPVAGKIWNIYAHGSRWRYASRSFMARASIEEWSGGERMETASSRSGAMSLSGENTRSGASFSEINIRGRRMRVKTDGRTVLKGLEYGTPAHVIRAAHVTKSGKPGFLAFTPWTVGSARAGSMVSGGVVFARVVHHPGTKAYGMIRRARGMLVGRIMRINRETVNVARAAAAGRV